MVRTDELLQKVENNLPPSDQMDDERGDEDDYEDVDDSDDDGDDDDDSDDSEEEEDEGYMFDNEYVRYHVDDVNLTFATIRVKRNQLWNNYSLNSKTETSLVISTLSS